MAIRYAAWAASVIGCGFGGAKLWPKHPIAGAAIGIIVVNPAIGLAVDAILPKAQEATP